MLDYELNSKWVKNIKNYTILELKILQYIKGS
jgi:hypothetical protein